MTLHRILSAALAATALMLGAGQAQATDFPTVGGSGQAAAEAICSNGYASAEQPGQYLVGLAGNVGAWVDNIEVRCANLRSDGLFSQPYPLSRRRLGGRGGGQLSMDCPPNDYAVAGVSIIMTAEDRQVKHVSLSCKNIRTGEMRQVLFNSPGEPGNISETGIGNRGQMCPPNELAVGFRVNYGEHVNALGLRCRQYAAAPVAFKPPPPAPAPTRPIGKTGRAQAQTSFFGYWDTRTSQGARFELVLERTVDRNNTDPNAVVGRFTNMDGSTQYNGTIRGSISGNPPVFTYTYVQPLSGGSGNGFFRLDNANTLSGTGVPLRGAVFSWQGTRK